MLDMAVLAEEIAAIVREQIDGASAVLAAENAELRRRLDAVEALQPVEAMVAAAVAALPAPQDGKSVTIDDVQPVIDAAVAAAVARIPPPSNGKDADPEAIRSAVDEAVAALPVPQDGKSVTVNDVEPLIEQAVSRAVAALPVPRDGRDADPDAMKAAIGEAVAALPSPADGKSVTIADVTPVIADEVAKAVAALPVPKDGVGLAGALIDRTGTLVMTLTDGKMCELGRVEGKDGSPGLGFDDLTFEHDGERGIVLRFARGDQVKEFAFSVPTVLDRGVFKEGTPYETGDAVTFGGSLWIAQKDTVAKPDGPDTGWRLAVKKGRDGRDLTGA